MKMSIGYLELGTVRVSYSGMQDAGLATRAPVRDRAVEYRSMAVAARFRDRGGRHSR
ncbi:MAG TPA: hypothetical protein VGN17_12305 [Bryobacteraceae bacterium]